MNILIRADASRDIGNGHVMRCLALATTLAARGAKVSFICRELPGNLCTHVENSGFDVFMLPFNPDFIAKSGSPRYLGWLGESPENDIEQTCSLLSRTGGTADWLIVDHYAISEPWERTMRRYARRLLVIDDLADRSHDCDILVNPTLQEHPDRRVGEETVQLHGPAYALLRQEFAILRSHSRHPGRPVKRILIFMGGADPSNMTARAIGAVTNLQMPGLRIDVVVGASNPHREMVEALCGEYTNIRFHFNIANMAQLMLEADLCVGAGGGATWERCCLGLPALAVRLEDNQDIIVRHASRSGVLVDAGTVDEINDSDLSDAILRTIKDKELLAGMTERGKSLVDGYGCERLARHMGLNHYKITVLSDRHSWINRFLPGMIDTLEARGHQVTWAHGTEKIERGDFAFIVGFGHIVPDRDLAKNRHNLVVHESDLPRGKGWSPLSWQILEGKNRIPITLFEAQSDVDSGDIYLQDTLDYAGHELVEELRARQADKTIELCIRFVDNYPESAAAARPQSGEPGNYRRRTPRDSRLDPDKSIREQMNLLRIADNDRYPAFFEIAGIRYRLRIEKE